LWGEEVLSGLWWGNLTEGENLEEVVLVGRIILKCILRILNGRLGLD
jgi:hypothetical protein